MNFQEYNELTKDEYLRFERILESERLSKYRDVCGFMYLAQIIDGAVIAGAEHDLIYFSGDPETFTEDQAIYLSRCGIHFSEKYDSLIMFT